MADDPQKKKPGPNGGTTSEASDLPKEVIAEIRKQAVQQVAKTTVAAAVGLIAIAGAGWFLYLKDRLPVWLNGVPKGTVAAFDLSDGCPDGWKPFDDAAGRFIIGAGQGKGLEERLVRAVGGQETHILKIAELPPQQISIPLAGAGGDRFNAGGRDYPVVGVAAGNVSIGGVNDPIPMLPPFLALTVCKKS